MKGQVVVGWENIKLKTTETKLVVWSPGAIYTALVV